MTSRWQARSAISAAMRRMARKGFKMSSLSVTNDGKLYRFGTDFVDSVAGPVAVKGEIHHVKDWAGRDCTVSYTATVGILALTGDSDKVFSLAQRVTKGRGGSFQLV